MAADSGEGNGGREFRLEGLGLLLVGGLLIVLLGAAFYIGRWYERQMDPRLPVDAPAESPADALANVADDEPPADVDAGADYFDDAQGGQKQLEPGREVPVPASAPGREAEPEPVETGPAAAAASTQTSAEGKHWVQVVSGRDRKAVEELIAQLGREGYSAQLFTEREGGDVVYKVRVGGYESREDARAVAAALKAKGHAGAWVKTVD